MTKRPPAPGPGSTMRGRVRVLEVAGRFFFGSTSRLLDRVDQVLGPRAVVFDCSQVPFIDLSAVFALEQMIEGLNMQGIAAFVVVPPAIRAQLAALRAPNLPTGILFDDYAQAKAAARIVADGAPGRSQT